MSFLDQGFQMLLQSEWMIVLLPFILVFAIVFGIMSKVKVFGEGENKKFSVIIALVMGLLVVMQHYTRVGFNGKSIVEIIMEALPQVGLVLIAIVMLFLMLGLFGGKLTGSGDRVGGVIGFVALLAVIYIFGSAAGFGWWDLPNWLRDTQVWSLIVVLLVFGLIIKYITGDDKPKDPEKGMGKEWGKFFFGSGDKK